MTFRTTRFEQPDDLLGGSVCAADAIRNRWPAEVVADERHLRQSRHAVTDRRKPITVTESELRNRLLPAEARDHRWRDVDAQRALKIAMSDSDDLVIAQRCD